MNLSDLDITHHWVEDEIYSKRGRFDAGVLLTQHTHPYDHASALVRGTVILEVDGVSKELTGPCMLMIEAGKVHSITTKTEAVWHCIHICSDTDPETVDATILGGK